MSKEDVEEILLKNKDINMKKKIIELYIEKDATGYMQLVALDEDGQSWHARGDYCGGVPELSWHPYPRIEKK